MKERDKKTVIISIRCTPEMEKRIKDKAERFEESVSEFTMDCISAGLKRKTRYDKKKARVLVEMQEKMNTIIRDIGQNPTQQAIKQELIDFSKEMVNLWDF